MNPVEYFQSNTAEALTQLGWGFLWLALLLATVYLLTRNVLEMYRQYHEGGWKIPPLEWTLRGLGIFLILAFDSWIVGALI